MPEGIWVAIITSVLSLTGVVVTAVMNRKKMLEEFRTQSQLADANLEKSLAIMNTRIDTLTDEVRKHNNFAMRVPVLEEKIKNNEDRLKYLESLGD